MSTIFLIAFGGALGAVARYGMLSFAQDHISHKILGLPASTLLVNVVGSVLIGISYVLILEKLQLPHFWRHLLMVGFLAAFTTFSTFALDCIHLLEAGHIGEAFGYIIVSVLLCIMGCWLAISVTRLV